MRFSFVTFLVALSLNVSAQKFPLFENYKWEKNPTPIKIDHSKSLYYYTKYVLAVEYEYDPYYNSYYKYKTEHYRVKLNSHVSIEEFNKVYLSMEDVVSMVSLKARIIKPSGEVKEFKPEVEEFYSDEESEQYYYFPVSGIELGDEIEIIYTLKMESAVDGDQFYFQGEMPVYNFDFYFVSPNDAWFNFLAHNGFPEPDLVDTIPHRHQWTSHLDSIPGFKAEYFSEYSNVTMKLDATLRGFENAADRSYSPYDNFETDLNSVYNVTYKGKDLKSIQLLSQRIGLSPRNKSEQNIRLIENYVKMNIDIDGDIPISTPMSTIISTERASSVGVVLLFLALLEENDIRFEYGFTSDRYDTHFSDKIESMLFMQSYIIYFPDIDMYLAPLDFSSRLGFLSSDWIPNNALLFTMKKYPLPETKGEVRAIPEVSADQNLDSTIITVNVDKTFKGFTISIERHITGYDAGEFQTYYYLYNDRRREEEEEALLDVLNDYSSFKTTSIQNTNPEDAFIKPLIIKGIVTELNIPLVEFTNELMIFKLGFLFGEYTDLKEIEKKKTDFVFGSTILTSTTVRVVFEENVKITAAQEIPQSDDLCPDESIRINSNMQILNNEFVYTHGAKFDKTRYSIDSKPVMAEVFEFWNSLHKMNMIIEKRN